MSTAPSPHPLSNSPEKMEESEENAEMVPDVNWNDQVMDPIIKTPSKTPASLSKKRKSLETTPSLSSLSDSSGYSVKKARQLLPSPGKRYLQAQEAGEVSEPQLETVEEIAEMVAFGEVTHEPPKVSKSFPLI